MTALSDFLIHEPKYGVLICTECRYAIQKNAIGGHLLRHKIYRGERQHLLSLVEELHLLEPDDVQTPLPGALPVRHLPVFDGLKCTVAECGYLCTSTKRMRRHWSDAHGVRDPLGELEISVKLQTFFRGTKIRYFEVSGSPGSLARPQPTNEVINPDAPAIDANNHLHELVGGMACQDEQPSAPGALQQRLDLATLGYFHQFLTFTSATLPNLCEVPTAHWRERFVSQALQHEWLMFGALAMSAHHLVAVSIEAAALEQHREHAHLYSNSFYRARESAKVGSIQMDVEIFKFGAQLGNIVLCSRWTSLGNLDNIVELPDLNTVLKVLQGCDDPSFALSNIMDSDSAVTCSCLNSSQLPGASNSSNAPLTLIERLRSLPILMVSVVDKPSDTSEFLEVLSAIELLVECFHISYAFEHPRATWHGASAWLRRLPGSFRRSLRKQSPPAMIVFSYWLALLRRAEQHCWFLRGLSLKVMRQIKITPPQARVAWDGTEFSP